MKSIILSFLLLSTILSLLPFVAFSRPSTTFIYDNPIVLPTTTHDNNDVLTPVFDLDDKPLKVDEEYMIYSIPIGGGDVYLTDLGNTECPSGVVQDNSGLNLPGTPVKFFTMLLGSDLVHENQDINIMFSIQTDDNSCFNETVWKVGDYFLGPLIPPPRFVETGGILGKPGPKTLKNWFKIEKYYVPEISKYAYKLRYCPSQYMCPDCILDCADIGLTDDRGHARLALNDKPFPFGFRKIKLRRMVHS